MKWISVFKEDNQLHIVGSPSQHSSLTTQHLSFMTCWTGCSVAFPVLLGTVVKVISHNRFTFAGGNLKEKRMSRNKRLPPWSQLATNLPLTTFWKAAAQTGLWNPYISDETVIVPRDEYVSPVVIQESSMYLSKVGRKIKDREKKHKFGNDLWVQQSARAVPSCLWAWSLELIPFCVYSSAVLTLLLQRPGMDFSFLL